MAMYNFARTPEQERRLAEIGKLADTFLDGAHEADRTNGFAYDHIEALRRIEYPAYTVPREYGGFGISLLEMLLYQERLAMGDPAIALGLGWHVSTMADLSARRPWEERKFARLCRAVAERGALVNKAATEAATGSPTRGGRPETTARRTDDGKYVLNGRKTFTTLAPVLDYVIVTATLQPDDVYVEFLIPMDTPGVSVDPTWRMVGMRGTASHDLVLESVVLSEEELVVKRETAAVQNVPVSFSSANPYLLHIPACYLGIALAARKEAMKFAARYQPNSLDRPILYVPHVGQKLAQIDLELSAARHYLYSVAARWEDEPDRRGELAAELGPVKVRALQAAITSVDLAMRIVGAHGLAESHPLQRLYRDVRFGLSNPPMEDMVMQQMAQQAVREAEAAFGRVRTDS
jgi:alkylation response protein AidB-like acyl-CoA dehydrogenase